MNPLRTVSTVTRLLTLGALLAALSTQARAETDPLPSWNDGPAKQAIAAFVNETTDQASPKFVPPPNVSRCSTTMALCGPKIRCRSSWPMPWTR